MIDAGRIGFVIKGEYDSTVAYEFLDVVYYGTTGNSYVAKKNTTGNTPEDNSEYWQILARGVLVDSTLSTTSQNPVRNSVITEALNSKIGTTGNVESATINSFSSYVETFPPITAGMTLKNIAGAVATWFTNIPDTFLPKTGDSSETTVETFDTVLTDFPTPEAGDTQSTLWGKAIKWFSDARGAIDSSGVEITQAQYDALSPAEKASDKVYYITDGEVYPHTAANTTYSNTTSGLDATDVQAAIDEVGSYAKDVKDKLPSQIAFGEKSGVAVPAKSYLDVPVSFGKTYSTAPTLVIPQIVSGSESADIGSFSISARSLTATGFTARIFNNADNQRSPALSYIALWN